MTDHLVKFATPCRDARVISVAKSHIKSKASQKHSRLKNNMQRAKAGSVQRNAHCWARLARAVGPVLDKEAIDGHGHDPTKLA